MIFAVAGIATVLLSWRAVAPREAGHGEYHALLLFSVLGMAVLVSAQDLVTLFLGIELLSIPLYVLCAVRVPPRGLARVRAEVPGHRLGRLGDARLRAGAGLRRHRPDRLRADRPGDLAGQAGRRRARRPDAADRPRAGDRRVRVQGLGGAVPPVDPGRLRGRPDADHRVHGDRHQGGGARRLPALLRRRRDRRPETRGRRCSRRSPRSRSSSATSARSGRPR